MTSFDRCQALEKCLAPILAPTACAGFRSESESQHGGDMGEGTVLGLICLKGRWTGRKAKQKRTTVAKYER